MGYTLCGNPEYLAPEVVENQGHSLAVDYWALGVLIYYMLSCETPFAQPEDSELMVYSKISSRDFKFPDRISSTARDLIDKLLTRDVNQRLGNGQTGFAALKKHPWFRTFNWEVMDSVTRDTIPAPVEMKQRMGKVESTSLEPIPFDTVDMEDWLK